MSLKSFYSLCMALLVARVGLVLLPDYGLVIDSLGTESGTVLCPGCNMLGGNC